MRYVIGIAPGATTGIGVVTAPGHGAGQPDLYGHYQGREIGPTEWLVQLLQAINGVDRMREIEVHGCIERPFLGAGERANPDTTIKLAVMAGQWVEAFRALGLPSELVFASQWQPMMLRGITASRLRADLKRAAAWVATMRWNVVLKQDEADAACIAAWAAERWTT